MSSDIWLAIITLLPIVSIFLLNVNGAAVFLSLCLGFVLYFFDAHNAVNAMSSLSSHITNPHLKPSDVVINLALLTVPAIITLFIQIKSVHGGRRILNLLPAVCCGLLAALLIVPALPSSLTTSIVKTGYWVKLVHYQTDIVGAGAAVALLFLWLNHKTGTDKKHSHKT